MSQISLFEGSQKLKITKPIRLIELFAGIGAQAKALENLGVPFEHYRVCEIDEHAVRSYNAIHGTDFVTQDITKLKGSDLGITDIENYTYILTYSFPCQDLSNAGLKRGMEKGSGTRSGLLWEVERLLTECEELPQILLMENVPQVVGEDNVADFAKWIDFLESKGYISKHKILNASKYGIPQNRNRCFMLSWLGDFYYDFPSFQPLRFSFRDALEDEVDPSYYLTDKLVDYFLQHSQDMKEVGNGFRFTPVSVETLEREREREAKAITTRAGSRMDDNFILMPESRQQR